MSGSTKKLNRKPVPRALVKAIKKWLKLTEGTGTKAKNRQCLDAHWHIGKDLVKNDFFTRPGLEDLAEQTGSTYSSLYRSHKFYEAWPKGLSEAAQQLSWSHHIHLTAIDEKRVRDFYIEQAIQQGWQRESLQAAIKNNLYDKPESERALPQAKPQFLDPLFVYVAYLVRVIDGDTIVVRLDLGFEVFVEKTVRLRGLNTAEMGRKNHRDPNAVKAREFVEAKLKDCPCLIVKTHKSDIYGRFVADVYYHPTLTGKEQILQNGFLLNQELLNAGLARAMMV